MSWNLTLVSLPITPAGAGSVYKLVPEASNRDQVPGPVGVRLDLLSHALDVHVEGLGVTYIPGSPDLLDQELAGEEPPLALEEQLQQLELLGGELDWLAVSEDLVAGGVELHRASGEPALGQARRLAHAGAAKVRPDARD